MFLKIRIPKYGIRSDKDDGADILTVYGGTVKASGTGNDSQAIFAKIKSGTSGIKFYFTDTEGAWGDGAYYGEEAGTTALTNRYAKAEYSPR